MMRIHHAENWLKKCGKTWGSFRLWLKTWFNPNQQTRTQTLTFLTKLSRPLTRVNGRNKVWKCTQEDISNRQWNVSKRAAMMTWWKRPKRISLLIKLPNLWFRSSQKGIASSKATMPTGRWKPPNCQSSRKSYAKTSWDLTISLFRLQKSLRIWECTSKLVSVISVARVICMLTRLLWKWEWVNKQLNPCKCNRIIWMLRSCMTEMRITWKWLNAWIWSMNGRKYWKSSKNMRPRWVRLRNRLYWKSMLRWHWKLWSTKLNLKMKTKVKIRKRSLKTELKSFKRRKVTSNLMRKFRWKNRKKMKNRKRWRKTIHRKKPSKNIRRDKNHWLTLKRDKLNKTQCFKLWFLSKSLQTPCFKQYIRRSISLRNQ